MAGWHFLTVETGQAGEIKKKFGKGSRGFGPLPVEVTLGKTVWKTSIFPSKDGTYVLPLKAQVRKQEGVYDGDTVMFSFFIR